MPVAENLPITAEYVRSILDYDSETGVFTWKERPVEHFVASATRSKEHTCNQWNSRMAGTQAGALRSTDGYIHICIDGKTYLAHRLAFLFVYGRMPVNKLDHKDTVRTHNRITNLREATNSHNSANRAGQKDNPSRLKGVSWHNQNSVWRARIGVGKRRGKYLGCFDCPAAASFAYQIAADKHYGEFARPF
jgi:hypothetical protein